MLSITLCWVLFKGFIFVTTAKEHPVMQFSYYPQRIQRLNILSSKALSSHCLKNQILNVNPINFIFYEVCN